MKGSRAQGSYEYYAMPEYGAMAAVYVGPLRLERPTILASGPRGDSPRGLEEAYRAGAGAVVTKSVTSSPRKGNEEPNYVPVPGGGYINALGLNNPGAAAFARILGRPAFPVIVSLAGSSSPDDYTSMIRVFSGVAGFELNLSCPHAEGLGREVGDDPKAVYDIVQAAKGAAGDIPVFAKVGPGMMGAVDAAVDANADGITAINTVPALMFEEGTGRPVLSHGPGGLSGRPIKPVALRAVYDIASKHGDGVPIMGCGGVSDARDAVDLVRAGASAVQIGTAAVNDLGVFGRVGAALPAALAKIPSLRAGRHREPEPLAAT